jgi:hypothetical protein
MDNNLVPPNPTSGFFTSKIELPKNANRSLAFRAIEKILEGQEIQDTLFGLTSVEKNYVLAVVAEKDQVKS